MNDMKDLGYANGWKETPEIVKKCNSLRKQDVTHTGWCRRVGNCLHEYGCDVCGYFYLVDSSG